MTRSVRIHEFGDAGVLRIEDVVTGEPGPGEVRLHIHAIGLNRTEVTLRSGRSPVKPPLPSTIGFEAAGVVEAIGPDVSGVSRPASAGRSSPPRAGASTGSTGRCPSRRRALWSQFLTAWASSTPRRS